MKSIDYESILCSEFSCNKFNLQLSITLNPSKERIIDAMKEAVRQVSEKYEEELLEAQNEISGLENMTEKLENTIARL